MPNYAYHAIDPTGKVHRGTLIALDDADMERRLASRGMTLAKSRRLADKGVAGRLIGMGVKPRILIEFYIRLSQALELGLPILSALDENARHITSPALRKICEETIVALEGGNTLCEALQRYPKVFKKLDLALIRMGEASGMLPQSLKELADFMAWKEKIRSTIQKAAIYPAFVMATIVAVIGVWVGYVLPRMAQVLDEMGVALPRTTQTVLNLSHFLRSYWLGLLAGILLTAAAVFLLQKTPQGAVWVHRYCLKIPLVGDVLTQIALARLSRNFSTLYKAGITMNNIFAILSDNVLGNRYLEVQLKIAFREIQNGLPLAQGFAVAEGFPPLMLGAIRNGELTGTIESTFKRLGEYYDDEAQRKVQVMISAFEPLAMLILGGVFGLIALSIMLPLYDVIADFGKAY